jgi:hypothetical protein
MKKTVKLTETDLTRIVGKVLSEQPVGPEGENTNTQSTSKGLPRKCTGESFGDMKGALNAGALEKIEFDYQNKAVFFSVKGKGRVCGVSIQDFMGMF